MAKEVAVLGVGMHPWGKWGRNFVEYGVHAARAALADAGLEWRDVQFVAGGDTMRNGYPGYVAAASIAQALGWSGAQVASTYGACATGAQAIDVARARILAGLCDVALVVGADAAPKGFFAPAGGDRPSDPDWQRFHLLGATNPDLLRTLRAPADGALRRDRTRLRAGQAEEQPPRARESERALPQARERRGGARVADGVGSPAPAPDLRHQRRRRRAGADEHASSRAAARPGRCSIAGVSTVTPRYPNTLIEMPNFATDSVVGTSVPDTSFRDSIAQRRLRAGGRRPRGRRSGGGLRSLDRARARLVREHRPVQARRSREAAARRRHRARRPRSGQRERRPVQLRRSDPGAGDRAGLRAHLAAARPGRRAPGGKAPRSASARTRASSATARPCS